MTTLRQIEANRLNAQKSTGPRCTVHTRGNALKHGLAGSGAVVFEDRRAAADEALARWRAELQPVGRVEEALVAQLAFHDEQMRRAPGLADARRRYEAERAAGCWDLDRAAEAEALGQRLAARPSIVQCELARTTQGCAWLVARWEGLGRVLEESGAWTEAQRRLALDLLGVPAELRTGTTRVDAAAGESAVALRRGVVAAELERLRGRQATSLEEQDGHDRAFAEAGHAAEFGRELRLLRRYEMHSQRRWWRAYDQLQALRRGRTNRATEEVGTSAACVSAPPPSNGRRRVEEFEQECGGLEEVSVLAVTATPIVEPDPEPQPDPAAAPESTPPDVPEDSTASPPAATPLGSRKARRAALRREHHQQLERDRQRHRQQRQERRLGAPPLKQPAVTV